MKTLVRLFFFFFFFFIVVVVSLVVGVVVVAVRLTTAVALFVANLIRARDPPFRFVRFRTLS